MQKLLISIITCAVFSTACTMHKIDVQQGNVLKPEMVAQIKPGMNQRQVKFILGTPMITDPFHPGRWDYVYRLQAQGQPLENKRLTLYFEDDILKRIEESGPEAK